MTGKKENSRTTEQRIAGHHQRRKNIQDVNDPPENDPQENQDRAPTRDTPQCPKNPRRIDTEIPAAHRG